MNKTIAERVTVWGGLTELNKELNRIVGEYEIQGYKVLSIAMFGDFSKIETFIRYKQGYNVIFTKEEGLLC